MVQCPGIDTRDMYFNVRTSHRQNLLMTAVDEKRVKQAKYPARKAKIIFVRLGEARRSRGEQTTSLACKYVPKTTI